MKFRPPRRVRWLSVPAAVLLCALTSSSVAQAADPKQQEASSHFDRGVTLSSEADYSGALVEFRRAYELAPNPLVLYNIGQTYFQLRNYAAALTHFERFLAEAGANPPHAAEVEQNIATLQSRVGKVDVESNLAGDVLVDGEPSGKTPQTGLRISIGRHRVAVKPVGQPLQEKTIELSAGDAVPLKFVFDSTTPAPAPLVAPPPAEDTHRRGLHPAALPLWIGAGVLAAGAVATGLAAVSTNSSLSDERENPAASRDQLDSLHGRMRALTITTDVLIGTAAVVGGLALFFTLSKPKAQAHTALGVSPRGLQLRFDY